MVATGFVFKNVRSICILFECITTKIACEFFVWWIFLLNFWPLVRLDLFLIITNDHCYVYWTLIVQPKCVECVDEYYCFLMDGVNKNVTHISLLPDIPIYTDNLLKTEFLYIFRKFISLLNSTIYLLSRYVQIRTIKIISNNFINLQINKIITKNFDCPDRYLHNILQNPRLGLTLNKTPSTSLRRYYWLDFSVI